MLNPRHTLTAFQKKMADKDYDNHKKRLAEIQKPKKNISEEKDVVMRSTFVDLHSKHVQFQTTEKVSSLDKTNKVLLDKLVKISRNQKPALFKSTHWTGHPGTLNTTYRKKELERIALENESMAKRLISQHSSVDHKKLKLDFLKHKEFSKNAQKNTYSSPKLSAKLPPLQSPKQEESPKDLRIKNKIKQRISESLSPAASKSQTLDKTQEAQPAIRVVDSLPENSNRKSNLSIQPQQAQERKEAPTSRSSQPQEAVEASARQSDSRRQSQVNENSQQEKQEVGEQGNEISRKTSTKTVGEGEDQVQSDKVEEKAVEVKEKEKEEEGEKSEKEEVEEKQEVVSEAQEVKKNEEEGDNKEVENKDKEENSNA